MMVSVLKTTAIGVVVFVLGRIAYQAWLGGNVVDNGQIQDSKGRNWPWYIQRQGLQYVPSYASPTGSIQKMGMYGKPAIAKQAVEVAIGHALEADGLKARPPEATPNVTLLGSSPAKTLFTASAATPAPDPQTPGVMPPMGVSAFLMSQ